MVSADLDKLLREGAEFMAAGKYEDAVGVYSEACQVANLETGKDDPDIMFLYGKALFENAVANNDVLGARKGNGEVDKEAGIENEDEDEEDGLRFTESVAKEEDEEDDDNEENDIKNQEDSDSEDPDGEEVKEGAEDEEEQSDFEIAWEILDLTRLLYTQRLASSEYENSIEDPLFIKLTEVYTLMGDISLETENFQQAVTDFTTATDMICKKFPEGSGRRLEVMFKLSLACEFLGTDDSIRKAVDCMQQVHDGLKKSKSDDTSMITEVENRLTELKSLLSETDNQINMLQAMIKGSSNTSSASNVTDLSNLVKKKKKQPGKVTKP